MNEIDRYVEEVLHRIAPGVPERRRIEADLRTHIQERIAAGEDEARAIARTGAPGEVARSYLAEVDLPPASRAARLGAFLFDVALGGLALGAVGVVAAVVLGGREPGFEPPVGTVIPIVLLVATVAIVSFLYFPVMEAAFGQTVGKRLFGTSVAMEGGERAGFGATVVRRIPVFFDVWPIDAAFLLFTAKRQRAFDIVARTVVLQTGGRSSGRRAWLWTILMWVGVAALFALTVAGFSAAPA